MLQVVSNFVSPSAQSALNGEMGLSIPDVAASLTRSVNDIQKLFDANVDYLDRWQKTFVQQEIREVTGHTYTRNVETVVLSVDDAKYLVARSNTHEGKMYTKWLIQRESKVLSYEEVMANILANPRAAADILLKKAEKDEALAKLNREKRVLESNFGKIAGKESGKALLQSENLQLKTSLGIAETYKSVKAALKIYPILYSMNVSAVGKALTKLSKEMGREVKKIPDSQYETVNAYHVAVIQAYAASLAHESEGA